MSWPTILWSMVAGASLAMALPHLIIGFRSSAGRVHLFFALAAIATAGLAAAELLVMHATTVTESGRALQLGQVPTTILAIAIVGFIRLYFGTGWFWLGVTACIMRVICLVINFADPPNLNFREITGLRSFSFLGEMVSMPVGPRGPWVFMAYASSVLLLVYVFDASRKLWRLGSPDQRRRAFAVGGSIAFFILVAQGVAVLVNAGFIDFPYFVSMPFMAIVVAMGFELSSGVIRSAHLARALRESEESMNLAAESARLTLWAWDFVRDQIWITDQGRKLMGFAADERIDFARFSDRVHPEDRVQREAAIRNAVKTGGAYDMEYRLILPNGTVRWIAARGRCTCDESTGAMRLLGVSMDITQQKLADLETRQQREELGHLARVALVGEMAASIAHELNQPLAAIVTNAAAAQRFLTSGEVKIDEQREILADIIVAGMRAGEVIRGIKGMVRKVPTERRAIDLNDVVATVLRLVRADAHLHRCTLATELEAKLPPVSGDGVQLQQVLLNLVLNAFDAMRATTAVPCRVEIATRLVDDETVEVSVRDYGLGLPAHAPQRIFERFFSTKREGMGMGLAIARSIIEAHRGTLDAENVAKGAISSDGQPTSSLSSGARFWFRLPVSAASNVPRTQKT